MFYDFSMPDPSLPPSDYNPHDYPAVAVTVDTVVFTVVDADFRVLLIERGVPPFKGRWALPGGFLKPDEDLATAAMRELAEETGTGKLGVFLEQLGTYDHPDRDPRMRVVTVAYWAILPNLPPPTGGSDAKHAELVPVSEIESGDFKLAFDHATILAAGIERARAKLEYSTVATWFCGEEFTMGELRAVYETVWGTTLDPGNFQRKVQQAEGFVIPLDKKTEPGTSGGRPATLFRAGPSKTIQPPISRT